MTRPTSPTPERAASAITEALTNQRPDPYPTKLERGCHYDEQTLAVLSLAIATINISNMASQKPRPVSSRSCKNIDDKNK
jgi:hypothetical protein